jgi:hypothetical protein
MFDEDKNLEVAYWIFDRDGNGEGSFNPWVVYQTGSFINCIKYFLFVDNSRIFIFL